MTAYVALLRAVNVGGTGKLPMSDLKAMCENAGFADVKTYIASGNVVFTSDKAEAEVKQKLETVLSTYAGKTVSVVVRNAEEFSKVLANNPYKTSAPNHTVAIFLDAAPAKDALVYVSGKRNEEIALGKREIYISYKDGIADSKLKIPAAKLGTARNINTIGKIVEMLKAL